MPSDADLNMLPPLLRMAATSSSSNTNRNKGTTTASGASKPPLLPPQQRPPTVRIPHRVNSFQTRKEQVDALQKIRCAPRADMMTEDERRKQTLLRRQTSKSRVDNEANNDSGPPPLPTRTINKEPAVEPSSSHSNNNATTSKQHSKDILEKKLEKVTKLLDKETPGSKEYKKLARKQEHYKAELEELAAHAEPEMDLVPQEPVRKEEDNFHEEEEEEEGETVQMVAPEKPQATTALEEEARMLKERAEALRAKRRSITAQEGESRSSPPYASPSPVSPVTDDRERKRQQAVEEYRRKQALKKEEEEQARQKAERAKEFKVLKKKVSKLEGMIAEAEDSGNDTSKLLKKLDEYIAQMQEYDEWEEEQEARRQAEEKARLRKEREDAERRRKEEQEAERRRLAEEEAERRRQEEVRREAERLRRRQLEEEEEERRQEQIEREQARRRQEREEEEERLRLQHEREEEEERMRQEQEDENERIRQERAQLEQRERQEREEKEMRVRQEREEEMLLAAQGRGDDEEFRAPKVDSEEAEVRAARDEELAKQQAEKERLQAERHQQMEEERAHRREELRQQTQAAEIEAASRAPAFAKTEASHEFIDIRNIPEPHSNNTKKLLLEIEAVQQRQNRLEKTLKQHGVAVSEDIPFDVAKDKIAELQEQMKLATNDHKKYYALEEEMSKYVTAMMLTDEFAEEQRIAEAKWEYSIEADNIAALRKVRSHMPVNIRNMTEEELTSNPTPNGKILPKAMALKFKRTNVLQLIRVNPIDLERMHPSLIEGLRSTGLTLTERRALHEHLKDVGAKWQELHQDPSIERKYSWFMGLKSKFKEMVTAYDKHVEEFGPPGNHPYAKRNDPPGSGCTLLGNQCPVKADSAVSYEEDYGYPQEAEFEGGMPAPTKFAAKSKRPSFSFGTKKRDDALIASIRERIHLTDEESAIDSKLLRELFFAEKRVISLEKQLAQNGIALPKEDIPYAVAKAKAAEITEEIKVVASKMRETTDLKESMALEKQYAQLSDDLEKYNNALMLTKEWAQELLETERKWEERVRPANQEALRKIRRHMPVNIKDLSEQDMMQGFTPNGKQLPQKIVRKFMRTNILQLVRMPPSMIEPMHPSSLESMRSTGLTLTERRALHEHLKDLGAKWKASSSDKMAERKWMWHESLRGKFKELVDKYDQHTEQYGPAENHPYAKGGESGGCPLIGKQCPVKADQEEDYSQDYGFPPEDVYNVEKVKKSNLLTVEELERRKNDDGWGYDAPVAVEDEPTRAPTAGLMAAIGVGGGVAKEESVSKSPMAGGLMAAIAAKGSDDRPNAPSGLLAAIQSRGDDKPKAPSGLLAAIQSRGDDKPKAPSGLLEAIQSRGDDKPKAPRGLFAAITGRGKK